jgi:hypothetical protein
MPVRDVPLDIGPEPGNVIGSRRLSAQAATLTVSALTAVKMRFDLNATQKPLLIALVGPACAGGRRRRTQQWDRIPPIRISLCSRQRQGSVARHDKRGYLTYTPCGLSDVVRRSEISGMLAIPVAGRTTCRHFSVSTKYSRVSTDYCGTPEQRRKSKILFISRPPPHLFSS